LDALSGGFIKPIAMRFVTLCIAASLFANFGCVQYHYSPNFIQTPYLEKKGNAEIKAAVSGSPISINGDFHASYSPIKHGVVMLNFYRTHSRFEDSNFFSGTTYNKASDGYLVEGAVGTYFPFSFGSGALYVGSGQGRMRNDYGIGRISDLRTQRFFIQPTFTFKNDWFRIGMGMRLVMLNFPSGKVDYRIEPEDIQIIQRLERESPFIFPEIGGNIGIHLKPITISANMVLVLTKPDSDYGFDGSNVGIGLSVELAEIFKKR